MWQKTGKNGPKTATSYLSEATNYLSNNTEAQQRDIICFGHVTNQMTQDGEDFEKGPDQGSHATLQVIDWTARAWLQWRTDHRHVGQSM
jgi:argininosuccinate lyase